MSVYLPSMSNDLANATIHKPVLKVIGMGGGGCNAIERMMEHDLHGIEFIAANTDHQALQNNSAPVKIQLGPKVTRGLGAGGNPAIGQAAAEESRKELAAALEGADMVFLTAGMGGGTGTGSIAVAAEVARSLGAVTIAIVTTPFSFELGRRQRNATEGLARLRQQTHTLITIPNDRLLHVAPRNLPLEVAFHLADDVLRQSVQGITELITETGIINVDFAHIRRLVKMGGGSLMSIGYGKGPDKVYMALDQALHHPLLESVVLDNAAAIIANFTGGNDLTLMEVYDALTRLQELAGNQPEIVMGVINNEQMEDRAQVILIITGLGATTLEEAMASVRRPTSEPIKVACSAPAPASVETRSAATKVTASTPMRTIAAVDTPDTPVPPQPPLAETYPSPAPLRLQADAAASQNLDLPAFLRRRSRQSGQAPDLNGPVLP